MNLCCLYLRMLSPNIEVSFFFVFVSITKPCCRWHIAGEIIKCNGHILVTGTGGSCDIGDALGRHNYCTKSNVVKVGNMEANGELPVSRSCTHLTHGALCMTTNSRKDAALIIESIWRKWDIVNDRPLPEGVERVFDTHDEKSEVVWKKTGSPYYSSMSNSSA